MELREYQKNIICQLRQSFAFGKKTPLVQLPTGSGKTVIAGEIIKLARERGKRVAFIVDRLALVDQTSRHLHSIGIDHGIIQSTHPMTDYAKPVQVVSIQTLARRRPWEFDLGIIDEAHIVFKAHKKLIETWDNLPFIGMSATPFTKGLGNTYDDLIKSISMQELIDQGFLVDADIFGPSKPDMRGVKVTGGDYNQKHAAKKADDPKLVADIVSTWLKHSDGRSTICFATNVMHSKHITEQFQNAGVNAHHIDAYTDIDNRREKIQAFKDGEIQILSSVGVLTTGFDAPNAEVEIIARPTKSLSLHIQMIGRVLRTNPGKSKALILDHAGNFERLGFHTDELPGELDNGEKKEGERSLPKPKPCPKCTYMKPPRTPKCPNCGHETKPINTVETEAGTLKQLKKANRETTPEQKLEFYSGLLGYALKKKYKQGWAAHKYKEKFGEWPNKYNQAKPKEPGTEVLNYIKYLNIKRAKTAR